MEGHRRGDTFREMDVTWMLRILSNHFPVLSRQIFDTWNYYIRATKYINNATLTEQH